MASVTEEYLINLNREIRHKYELKLDLSKECNAFKSLTQEDKDRFVMVDAIPNATDDEKKKFLEGRKQLQFSHYYKSSTS